MEHSMMGYRQAALCIIVLAMSGVSLGESGKNKAAQIPLFDYELTIGITNQIYTDSLLNAGSADYQILSSKVRGALYSIYGCVTCNTHKFYQGVSAMTFSNHTGSVLVKVTLMFQSNETNAVVIKSLFLKAIEGSNEIDGLKLKPEFSEATSTPTTTTTTASTHSTISTSRPTATSPIIHPSTRPTTTTTNTTNTTPTRPITRPTNTTPTRPTTRPTNTSPTLATTHPTNTPTTRPTNTSPTRPTTHPTHTTTNRPTPTTSTIATRPTIHSTSKRSGPHNAASSFFHQRSITLTSFFHFTVSFCLFFLISCSF